LDLKTGGKRFTNSINTFVQLDFFVFNAELKTEKRFFWSTEHSVQTAVQGFETRSSVTTKNFTTKKFFRINEGQIVGNIWENSNVLDYEDYLDNT
jgi:cobyric acid synthase